MGKTVQADMYGSGYVRKRAADEYGERRYDRRVRTGGAGEESGRVAWKEPIYVSSNKCAGKRNIRETEPRGNAGNSKRSVCRKKKKKMQYRILRGILIYFILAGIAATCFMIFNFFTGGKEKVHAEDASVFGEPEGSLYADGQREITPEILSDITLEITPEMRQKCQKLYSQNEALLVLVNKEHELPASYEAGLRGICEGRLQAADILYEDLCAMLRDAGEEGFQYWIASACRDRAYQQGLVEEDVEKYMAKGYTYEAALQKTYEYTMPAGKSEHETGLALDILCSTNTTMDESQAYEPGNKWLAEHCHEYGFILRYPADREDVTGIKYEPWHFRYVGREAAAFLTEKGWTLEEFYDVLNGSF